MENELLEEIWINRDEFAKEHHYNLDEIVSSLQKKEEHPLSTVIDRSEVSPKPSVKSAR